MTEFGDRVRDERQRLGMSRRGLSRAAGLSQTHARLLEVGEISATTAGAEAVAGAMGLALADLLLSGPPLFEVEFQVGPIDICSPDIERIALESVPPQMLPARVAVWPWSGDGCLRLRARASCLPALVDLAGSRIPGVSDSLPRPRVWAVEPSAELEVLVRASGARAVQRQVLTEARAHDCCPPVAVQHVGRSLWLARLTAVSERCSMGLQRLAPDSPVGLFVPA